MKYRVCKNKGCRRKASEVEIPLPYEYHGGKHIIIFGWVFHIYKDKSNYANDECDECLLEAFEKRNKPGWGF